MVQTISFSGTKSGCTRRTLQKAVVSVLLLLVLAGCSGPNVSGLINPEAIVRFTEISAESGEDQEVAALVRPYAESLLADMSRVIGNAPQAFDKTSGLDEFVADAILARARKEWGSGVQVAMVNRGGIRAGVSMGPVTVGTVFEVLPFDNTLVKLELSGSTFQEFANQMAARGGEGIAGFQFRIEDGNAVDIRIGDELFNPDKTYFLATLDYLAEGGGGMSSLLSRTGSEDSGLLLRDIAIEYITELTAQGLPVSRSGLPRIRN